MRSPGLDLGMAVGAEQDALAGFRPCRLQRAGHAAARKRERLLTRIDVVEMQAGERAVVSADDARAAGLGDENPLALAPAPVDRAGPTQAAAEAVRPAPDERRQAVDGT